MSTVMTPLAIGQPGSDRADGSRQVNLPLDPLGDGRDARVDVDALPFPGLDLGPDDLRTSPEEPQQRQGSLSWSP